MFFFTFWIKEIETNTNKLEPHTIINLPFTIYHLLFTKYGTSNKKSYEQKREWCAFFARFRENLS